MQKIIKYGIAVAVVACILFIIITKVKKKSK